MNKYHPRIFLVVVLIITVTLTGVVSGIPSVAESDQIPAISTDQLPAGNAPSDLPAGNAPDDIKLNNSTETQGSDQEPANNSTTKSNSTNNNNTADGTNISNIVAIIEVEENGNRIMVSLQGTEYVDKSGVKEVRVEGITTDESLSIKDDYPMVSGHINRPTKLDVIVVLSDGTEHIITSRKYD